MSEAEERGPMMVCQRCQHQNTEGANFCENCGAKLARLCPHCGYAVTPAAKFCPNCGQALEAVEDPQISRLKRLVPKEFAERLIRSSAGPVERERRVVTILFSDVKGSTALGEELDPEQVLEIMNGAFDILIESVYRYEGTLARLMGDAILAFFGAPIAHEDDPIRAVLAGLAIQGRMPEYAIQVREKYGIEGFSVRVGINTGLVVVGEVGSDLRVEYTAMGDAINVASRLENAAEPGTVVISGQTARLVGHAFNMESVGPLTLKGKSEPVEAFRVVGRKAVPTPARGIEGLHSPLVGREVELGKLKAVVEELERGRGQIVSLVAEAGLGKSRLIAELKQWAETRQAGREREGAAANGRLTWLEGRSLSYQSSTPYAPFVDLFSDLFGLMAEEKDEEKYQKVKAFLSGLLPNLASEIAPFIATMLGIELIEDADRVRYLMPPDVRERIFGAVASLLEELARHGPTVVVLEDLHWADPTSLDLAIHLMETADRAGLGLIALFRPVRQEPAWRYYETATRDFPHRHIALQLEPLDESRSRELVANLLEIEDLPETVRALILSKAEGNPFFVEEVIRSLLDAELVVREDGHWRATREIAHIQLPDTLGALITARLDRLDEQARHVAQTAAVIGREFEFDVLREVYEAREELGGSLRDLQRRELIREKSRLPLVLYLFKHALTQEAAYNSVLLSKRRELHRRVAECIERVEPERVNEIARHLLEAKQEERALPYLIAAGEQAARAYSMTEAIDYLSRAAEIARTRDNLPLTRRAFEGLGSALTFTLETRRAIETYEEMLTIAQEHGDVPMQVSAMNKLAYIMAYHTGQFPEAEKRLAEAERLARANEDKVGLSEMFFVRCGMCTAVGDYDTVVTVMEQAAQFGRELGVKDQIATALDHVARSYLFMTRFDEAWKTAQDALRMAREIGNLEIEAALLTTTIPLYHLAGGDLGAAERAAQEGLGTAERIGSAQWVTYATWGLGTIAQLRGDFDHSVDWLQQSVQTSFRFQQSMPFIAVPPLAALGSVLAEMGDGNRARVEELHTRALELMNSPAGAAAGGTVWADIGFTLLAQGQFQQAGELFDKGLNYPTMMGYFFKPRFLVGRALALAASGQIDGALSLIEQARQFVHDRGMRYFYPLVALAEAEVCLARGQADRALELYQRAESLAEEMKFMPTAEQARTGARKAESLLEVERRAQ